MAKVYEGYLHNQRKPALTEICNGLSIPILNEDGETIKRTEMESLVRKRLLDDQSAREDPRFIGLWHRMAESRQEGWGGELSPFKMRGARRTDRALARPRNSLKDLSSSSAEDEDDSEDDEDETPEVERSPMSEADQAGYTRSIFQRRRTADAVPAMSHDSVKNGSPPPAHFQKITRSASSSSRALAAPTPSPLRRVSARSRSRAGAPVASTSSAPPVTPSLQRLARKSSVSLKKAAVKTSGSVADLQALLSTGWSFNLACLFLEFAWIAFSAVPWSYKLINTQWLFHSPTSHNLLLPELQVLLHNTFAIPALLWAAKTFFLPLLIASVVTPPASRSRRSKRPAFAHPALFAVMRLATSVLFGYIFPGKTSAGPGKWSLEEGVEGYPAIQVLGASVAALYSFSEHLGVI